MDGTGAAVAALSRQGLAQPEVVAARVSDGGIANAVRLIDGLLEDLRPRGAQCAAAPSPVPLAWSASSRTEYRHRPRGSGARTVMATSALHAPSPGQSVAARTRDPAGPAPSVGAPARLHPYLDRTAVRVLSRHSQEVIRGSRPARTAPGQLTHGGFVTLSLPDLQSREGVPACNGVT